MRSYRSSSTNQPSGSSNGTNREKHQPLSSRFFQQSSSSDCVDNTQLELTSMIPKLSFKQEKGDCGKVCVVGGSRFCTGAPVLAALTALNAGADIVIVITTPSASKTIKCSNPLLIVAPFLPEEDSVEPVKIFCDRVWPLVHDSNAVCFGPGLGTNDCMLEAVSSLLLMVRLFGIPVVVDMNVTKLLEKNIDLFYDDLPKSPVFVTLNVEGFEQLYQSVHTRGLMSFHQSSEDENEDKSDKRPEGVPPRARGRRGSQNQACPVDDSIAHKCPILKEFQVHDFPNLTCVVQTAYLSRALGGNVIIIRKGMLDIVTNGFKCIVCAGMRVPKRCAGQSDIVPGLLATFAAWLHRSVEEGNRLIAAYGACLFTRLSTLDAYEQKSRAFTANDIIDFLPSVFLTALGVFEKSESLNLKTKTPSSEFVPEENDE